MSQMTAHTHVRAASATQSFRDDPPGWVIYLPLWRRVLAGHLVQKEKRGKVYVCLVWYGAQKDGGQRLRRGEASHTAGQEGETMSTPMP